MLCARDVLEHDDMNGYITVQEAAIKWAVTDRQVQLWCKDGKISGATMLSRIWIIPENAERPISKKKQGKGGA
jgi:predicted site-specific integrase-resolvase